MGKKNAKKLLISISLIIFLFAFYICVPFLINFDDQKKIRIENLVSETISYDTKINGDIQYKLNPLPVLEISNINLTKNNENSILEKVILNISIFDLIRNRFTYGDVLLSGGEFIIDLNNVRDLSIISNFKNKKIKFNDVNLRFFNGKESFNLNQSNIKIFFKNKEIEQINGKFNIGEVSFQIYYKEDQLSLKSKEIDFKVSIENFSKNKKKVRLNFNQTTFFPGIKKLYTDFEFEKNEETIYIKTNKFNTNLFSGFVEIKKNNPRYPIEITGKFENANFKKIDFLEFEKFLQENLSVLANFFDAKASLLFENMKTKEGIFDNAKITINFLKGDMILDNFNLESDVNKLNVKGRNILYQKDNLFFYDLIFETSNIKNLCTLVCLDKSLVNKINNKEFKLKSKGLLNIDKSKVTVEENFTDKQFNDNELKKLSTTLNTSIISGKLENLFNISRYFNLF
jgi:hypothetical protein